MASLTLKGKKRLQAVLPGVGRVTVWLGKMDRRTAELVKLRVEKILQAREAADALDPDTAKWVRSIGDELHEKLSNAGILEPRHATQLQPWARAYMQERGAELKPASRLKLEDTIGKLIAHFGATQNIRLITPEMASKWQRWLREQQNRRRDKTKTLSPATVRTHCGNAKGLFAYAVHPQKYLHENPFGHLESGATATKNDRYVTPEEARKILDACTDWRLRVLFALTRYAGLRVTSEALKLRWGDVHWDTGRMTVWSPKTERTEGKEKREVPITPLLRPYLEEAFQNAEEGAEKVCPLRGGWVRGKLPKVIQAARVTPWRALFQTLRSSCEKEWALTWPQYVVSLWIGHDIKVSGKHYANAVPEAMFEAAAGVKSGENPLNTQTGIGTI